MTNEFEKDIYDYPTRSTLGIIKKWGANDGFTGLMEFIAPYFNSGYGRCEYRDIDETWEVVTGGWSGNEEIINALQTNRIFWYICWKQSKRGGYYEFDRMKKKEAGV